mgnify:CR=1 FL=1
MRYRGLGITDVYVGASIKKDIFEEFLYMYELSPEEVMYMGDDIPDLECMAKVGIPVCPADACAEVQEAARYVSEFKGGRGAVRDIIEQTLRAQDEWAKDCNGVICVASR